jgi:hypothetical protein
MTDTTSKFARVAVQARASFACAMCMAAMGSAGCVAETDVSGVQATLEAEPEGPAVTQACTASTEASTDAGATASGCEARSRTKRWRRPRAIESYAAGDASDPKIAVNARGAALVTWVQFDGTYARLATRGFANARWRGARLVANDTSHARRPSVGLDASGRGLLVWEEQPDPGRSFGLATTWSLAAGPAAPTQLIDYNPNSAATYGPLFAAHADGRAIAIWGFAAGRGVNVGSYRYDPGTGWATSPVSLEWDPNATGPVGLVEARVALGAGGEAFTTFAHSGKAWANRSTLDLPRGTVSPLGDRSSWTPGIAVDASGNAVAAWNEHVSETEERTVADRYVAGSGWTGPVTVASTLADDVEAPYGAGAPVRPIYTSSGRACVTWLPNAPSQASVRAACWTGSAWETPVAIDVPTAGESKGLELAADGGGNLVAVWSRSDGVTEHVYANRYVARRGWTGPTQLDSGSGGDATTPSVGLDASGNGIAVWSESEGAYRSILASRFE